MVSIELTLPEGVIQSEFDSGKIYVDPNLTEEMVEESGVKNVMNEIINRIRSMREEMELNNDTQIEVQIFVSDALADSLEESKDDIASGTNAYSVEFPLDDSFEDEDYHINRFTFQEEEILIGIVPIEFEGD